MPATSIIAILALVGYAVYRQSQRHEVIGESRFKLAIVYGIVGLCVGGFSRPEGADEWGLLAASILLSVVVGIARGFWTKLDRGNNGGVYSQGTALTIGLFLGMVAVKFGLGFWAYEADVSDDGGFGEVMLMIAVMVAFQAELIWRRARPMGARLSTNADSVSQGQTA